jgi:hypothetical protein
MYRFIDIVSIDVMSINGYHWFRRPREEGTVEAGTLKEVALQHDFPDARLEAVVGSRALVPEDGPDQLARLIEEFLGAGTMGPATDCAKGCFPEIDTDCNTLAHTV